MNWQRSMLAATSPPNIRGGCSRCSIPIALLSSTLRRGEHDASVAKTSAHGENGAFRGLCQPHERFKRRHFCQARCWISLRGSPAAIVTDGLRPYKAAMTELGTRKKQDDGRWANNRVENSHLPFRLRERAVQRLRRIKTRQNSPRSTRTSPTTSPPNASSLIADLTSCAARALWPSGSGSRPDAPNLEARLRQTERSAHRTHSTASGLRS